jgi:uncharacterized protein involved in exopolysaccharide biosynthesis
LIDSQVEILKSEDIARAVIKDLHLLDDPELSSPPADHAAAQSPSSSASCRRLRQIAARSTVGGRSAVDGDLLSS